ncbi:hypothetical protein [Mycobacterium arosiense]|nr:hypothetical protein [Mycobacterium arosiense]
MVYMPAPGGVGTEARGGLATVGYPDIHQYGGLSPMIFGLTV